MSESRWVQHKSGEGKKWPIHHEAGPTWWSWEKTDDCKYTIYLPKSEYNLCEPPASDAWVDVTTQCEFRTDPEPIHALDLSPGFSMPGQYIPFMKHYRLRKIEINQHNYGDMQCAFIVERRTPS